MNLARCLQDFDTRRRAGSHVASTKCSTTERHLVEPSASSPHVDFSFKTLSALWITPKIVIKARQQHGWQLVRRAVAIDNIFAHSQLICFAVSTVYVADALGQEWESLRPSHLPPDFKFMTSRPLHRCTDRVASSRERNCLSFNHKLIMPSRW